jgi:hypothetical protein
MSTSGNIDIKDSSSNDREYMVLCDTTGPGTGTQFLRRLNVDEAGVTTVSDTTLDGVTPYVVTGTVAKCIDEEYYSDINTFCALVDSPIDYPNVGDPAGTAYQAGDKVLIQFLIESHNVFTPYIVAYKNMSNGTFPVPFYLEIAGSIVIGTAPPNPADFGDCPDKSCIKVEPRCKCDDTLNDGSAIVNFVQAYQICVVEGVITSTLLGSFTDDTYQTPYVPVGTVVDCADLGTDAKLSQQRIVLTDIGSWSSSGDVYSYTVKAINAPAGTTFTDSLGVVSNLYTGEVITHTSDSGVLLDASVTITTVVGSVVIIDFEKLI